MPPSRSAADAKYLGDLTEFVALMDEYSKDKWTLNKSEDGVWLKQSVMIKNEIETFNRQTHILRSAHYDVPVLWFNFYHRDGRPLRLDEISDLLTKNDLTKCSNLARLVTQEVHPYYGVLFFFIDPRKAKKNFEDLEGNGNFIVRWLSLYGRIIGMTLPDEILLSVGIDPQTQNAFTFTNGSDSLSSGRTLSKSTCVSINEDIEEVEEIIQKERIEEKEENGEKSIQEKLTELRLASVPDSLDSAHNSPISSHSQ